MVPRDPITAPTGMARIETSLKSLGVAPYDEDRFFTFHAYPKAPSLRELAAKRTEGELVPRNAVL
jgi:hypothetical protein